MARQAYIVTDISYGDAGKGTTVDYLARSGGSTLVVRHNGGAQAAHNVVTPDGRHHTFSQFGSGSFVPGVRTHLSRHMLVNPLNMMQEAEHLIALGETDIWQRTTVDEDALVVLPWHQAANRLRELARGTARHGSCGQGIGEAQSDALTDPDTVIRVGDLLRPLQLPARLRASQRAKFERLRAELNGDGLATADEWAVLREAQVIPWLCNVYQAWRTLVSVVPGEALQRLAATHELLVFEGAQGVLLDEAYGFHPYTTWSKTTPENARGLLSEIGYTEPVTQLGILRGYTTRHGAGPFVSEDTALAAPLRELHNDTGEWQGAFRYGHLDLLAHRYAVAACNGLDGLVVTGLDRLAALPRVRYCTEYTLAGQPADAATYVELAPGNVVTDLRVGPTDTRDHQARLTELLFNCSPVYQEVSAQPGTPTVIRDVLRVTEDHLGLPVFLTSFGPSATDKRVHRAR